jgi:hypothetical protein
LSTPDQMTIRLPSLFRVVLWPVVLTAILGVVYFLAVQQEAWQVGLVGSALLGIGAYRLVTMKATVGNGELVVRNRWRSLSLTTPVAARIRRRMIYSELAVTDETSTIIVGASLRLNGRKMTHQDIEVFVSLLSTSPQN